MLLTLPLHKFLATNLQNIVCPSPTFVTKEYLGCSNDYYYHVNNKLNEEQMQRWIECF